MRDGVRADAHYIRSLDGLRAIAILIVIASHFGLSRFVPGEFGVTIFFFISGFLITRLLVAEIKANGSISIPDFYIRRFLRLGPPLLGMIGFTLALKYFSNAPIDAPQGLAAALYFMNYFIILGGQCIDSFVVLWSLSVEEHYYLLYPIALALAWKFQWRFLVGLIAICAAVILWRAFLVFDLHVGRDRIAYATDTRIDSIIFGAILSVALESRKTERLFIRMDSLPAIIVSTLTLLATFVIRNEIFRETVRYTLQGVGLFPLIYATIFSSKFSLVRLVLEHPIANWIGRLSYSLYLWHLTAVLIVATAVPYLATTPYKYVLAIPIVVALSSLSYYALELPAKRLRNRFRSHLVSDPKGSNASSYTSRA